MSFLEGYGLRDARREKYFKLGALAVVVALIVGPFLYLWLRDRTEKQKVQLFLELLRNRDYKAAYVLWGCTEEKPCRDYDFSKFMEDWGPGSPQANVASAKVNRTKHCDTGIVEFVAFPDQHEVKLWVERQNKTIGFAPWSVPRNNVSWVWQRLFDEFGPCNLR
jgi:hypothetical protein